MLEELRKWILGPKALSSKAPRLPTRLAGGEAVMSEARLGFFHYNSS